MAKPATLVKSISLVLAIFFTSLLIYRGVREVLNKYEYSRTIKSYWELSIKASTLEKKSEYLDQFVEGLKGANLSGNNAVFLKTPDNSYEQNFAALTSLQRRMHEINEMNPKSFEYQLAIGQITAQEQGEAGKMLDQLEGVWYLNRHPTYWKWYDTIFWLSNLLFAFLAWAFFGGANAVAKERGPQSRATGLVLVALVAGFVMALLTGVFLR
jgi:hypothetical protein